MKTKTAASAASTPVAMSAMNVLVRPGPLPDDVAPAVALAVARGRAVAVVPTVAGEVAGDDVEGTAVVVEATPGVAPAVGRGGQHPDDEQ